MCKLVFLNQISLLDHRYDRHEIGRLEESGKKTAKKCQIIQKWQGVDTLFSERLVIKLSQFYWCGYKILMRLAG